MFSELEQQARHWPELGAAEYDPAHDTRVRWFGSVKPGTASRTAQRVAACRLTFERVPFCAGDPAAEEKLARDLAGPVRTQSNEAMVRYLAARTLFFDRVVVNALNREVTQVVVAGAGYDGRALRYGKPGVTWYEVDHPDTQHDKRMRLHRLGIETPNVVFVPADFGDEGFADTILQRGYDASKPSLLLCEGVAVYLDPRVLGSLLRGLRLIASSGSRLAISFSVANVDSDSRTRFRLAAAAMGEPARNVLTADDADALLTETRWAVTTSSAPAESRARARQAGFVIAEPIR